MRMSILPPFALKSSSIVAKAMMDSYWGWADLATTGKNP